MELFSLTLVQGIPYRLPYSGRFFRILQGSENFVIKTSSGVASKYLVGIGIELPPFEWIEITSSDKDQKITGLVSMFPVDDSRLVGEVATGFLTDSATLNTATAGTLFPVNLSRKVITVSVDQDLYICEYTPADTNGFLMSAGTATFENSGALYAYNDSGFTCNISTLEEVI